MRVLQLVTSRRPFFRQQVTALERRGISCTTVAVPGRRGGDPDDGRSPTDYARFYRDVLAAKPWTYDVVHANYGLTAPAALAQPGRPVVLSLWGSDVFGSIGPLSRACARLADAVVVMSPEMAAAVDADCYVVPHGVDFDAFRPMPRDDARAELGWDPDAYHVLFPYDPGREAKNYPRAERIVEAARERLDGEVRLQVVSGEPHERIPVYMNAADALLLTSRHEGSPNAVREALACNLPVVSTDVGDVRRWVDGVSPSAVSDSDEELAAALVDALRSDATPNGREAVRAASLDAMGRRLEDVYRDALGVDRRAVERQSGTGTGSNGSPDVTPEATSDRR